jgi:hypothetical protein
MRRKELQTAIDKYLAVNTVSDEVDEHLHRLLDFTFFPWNCASVEAKWPAARFPSGHPDHTIESWAECARCGATLEGYYDWVAIQLNQEL